MKRRLYIASPLHSIDERSVNLSLRALLEPYFTVYLPQEDGGLMTDMIMKGTPLEEAQKRVFAADVWAIRRCEYMLAVFSGRSIDEGVAVELGMAYMLGKICIGYQVDPQGMPNAASNPMISCALQKLMSSRTELMSWAYFEALSPHGYPDLLQGKNNRL